MPHTIFIPLGNIYETNHLTLTKTTMTKKLLIPFLSFLLLTACNEQKPLENSVSMDGVWNHLEQFDKIAKENNSNRAVGTPGGIASKEYIKQVLGGLGLTSTEQTFTNRGGSQGCNVIVEIKGKSEQKVVLIGSHYDSVKFGPGINDNASGVATLLEIIRAIQNNKITPVNTLRFAFWDSEETGVEGSPVYYNSLSEVDKKQIIAYLNVDMVASIDGEVTISDTDGSTIDSLMSQFTEQEVDAETMNILKQMYESVKFAEGSSELEQMAKDIFTQQGITVKEDLQFARNSDTGPFLAEIPTLGISVFKIITEPTEDGGEAVLFAPCYHQACDDINNVDKGLLGACLKTTAAMIQKLAIDKEAK